MIEYDENGEQWFGYTFSSEDTDPGEVMKIFIGNVQYAEWLFRQVSGTSKRTSLADQLHHLFNLLPTEAEGITDDRIALIRQVVSTRNRHAHGKFEETQPPTPRVHTLSVKIAALLSFAEMVHEGHSDEAVSMARRGSPYIRQQLVQTDSQ
jgi:hypothetical protein